MNQIPSNWKYLGEGRHRKVYALPSGRNVIKIPIGRRGEVANLWEAIVWRNRHEQATWPWMLQNEIRGIKLARCRLVPGTYNLVMEKLLTCKSRPSDPWVMDVDCYQVGKDRQGRFKAYDFAQFEDWRWREAVKELSKLEPNLHWLDKNEFDFQFKLLRK